MATKLAAQMYTLREYTQTPEGIDRSLEKVKAVGYDAVQMSAWGKIDPAALRALADKHELEICATHVSFDRIVEETERTIAEHKIWGTKYVGLGAMPEKYRGSVQGVRELIKVIKPAAQKICDSGLKFIYHNHNFEFAKVDGGSTIMDVLLAETDPSWFQFEIDTYWVQAGGADPARWIRNVGGRMDVVHFKDMVYSHEHKTSIMAEVGEGNLNWKEIIEACGEIGIRWHIVEQDTCQRDPFESLRISAQNLKAMNIK